MTIWDGTSINNRNEYLLKNRSLNKRRGYR